MAEETLKSVAPIREFKSEAELAQEIKDALRPLAEQVAAIMERANKMGMQPGYSITPNAFGKFVVSEITITKQI